MGRAAAFRTGSGYLLKAEQDRSYERTKAHQAQFRERATSSAREELTGRLAQSPCARLDLRKLGFDLARDVARAWLNRWLDDELPAGNNDTARLPGASSRSATSFWSA